MNENENITDNRPELGEVLPSEIHGEVGEVLDEKDESLTENVEKEEKYASIIEAAQFLSEEALKIQAKINSLEQGELIRLGDEFQAFLLWCKRREELEPDDPLFYVYEDAWKKAKMVVQPLRGYIENMVYRDVLFSLGLHYIIVEPFTYEKPNAEGGADIVENPLYSKYKIESKAYLISSASDEGSSSSIHVTNSLQNGDFFMQDLLRTRYGSWVYSILEQLDIGAVLL